MNSSGTANPGAPAPIGFIGLGAMGAPMARRLAGLGYPLLVHDLDTNAVATLVQAGAQAVSSPRQIADQASIVFTCLPSLAALETVVLGPDALVAGQALEVLVDFSTTGSDFACSMAERLAAHGVLFLDAPITGNVISAGNGGLGIMCSGPQDAFERVQPALRDLASAAVLYLGPAQGRAQRLKLLNNLLSATGMAVSCEGFILGAKGGLDATQLLALVNAGESSSSATRNKFARSVLPRKFDFGARMAITAKDTSLTVHEAQALGVPMWIGQAVQQVWAYAAAQGGASLDGTSLITFLEPWAGVQVGVGAASPPPAPPPEVDPSPDVDVIVCCEVDQFDALARRLVQQGWQLAHEGQHPAAEPSRQCRLVCIPAGADPQGLLPEPAGRRRLVVNSCLIGVEAARRWSQSLAERGDGYLEALLAGTIREIEQGTARVVAGGAAVSSAAGARLLAGMGGQVFVASQQAGDAQLMQLVNAGLAHTLLAATCEAYVTGAKCGLDASTMKQILGLETGRNVASEHLLPEQVALRRFDHGKTMAQAARELSLLSDEARRLGVTPWILDKTRLLYRLAVQLGDPQDDVTRLAVHYETWAGTQVRAVV